MHLSTVHPIQLPPKKQSIVPTGIGVQFPKNTFGLLKGRSGLAAKGIDVLGGVIDPDYQGEIKFILYNGSDTVLTVESGERVGQLLVLPLLTPNVSQGQPPSELTKRGMQGFGSTDGWKPGAKVWVTHPPNAAPRAAEVVAQGPTATLIVMYPGNKQLYHVPKNSVSLRE